jgi:hypothetical protein
MSATLEITCVERGGLARSFQVRVATSKTVQAVREALALQTKRKVASLLLFDGEDYLQNHVALADYGIADGAILRYESRMCGILPADHDWSTSGLKVKQTRFAF